MKIFHKKNSKKIFHSLVTSFLFATLIISSQIAYADVPEFGAGRVRSCSASGGVEALDFNPTDGGKDVNFVLDNPVCAATILSSYAAVKLSIAAMNSQCGSGSTVPRVLPSPFQDAIDIARATIKVSSGSPSCKATYATCLGSFATAMGILGGTFATAKVAYDNTTICGANWTKPSTTLYDRSTADYKKTVQLAIEGYSRNDPSQLNFNNKTYREYFYNGVEFEDNPYSGEICYDVTQSKNANGNYPRQKYYLKGTEAGNFNCSKYDMRENQNDPRDNTRISKERLAEFQRAYACCKKRSQEYVCIQYSNDSAAALGAGVQGAIGVVQAGVGGAAGAAAGVEQIESASNLALRNMKFCQVGTHCIINGITFSAKSIDSGRLACAESYSVCPYNFSVGGGTEYCDFYQDGKWSTSQELWVLITQTDIDAGTCSSKSEIRNSDCTYNDKAGKCKNYCQYLTHCTRTSGPDFRYTSGIVSPYFSAACLNFEGDSQNKSSYATIRHFSTPIAQCVKETLENVFYNRAGHSKCLNFDEYPSSDGSCPSGQYATTIDGFEHKVGNRVKQVSFFSTIQNGLQAAVKMVLCLSLMFYGMNVLLGKANIGDKKDILIYIVKIGLVIYFATGDAWQTMFFRGVYSTSSEFSRMVFKIEADQLEIKRDGCQFGTISLHDGTQVSSGRTYPAGKEYLALWDTLDCKIAIYLGFGPQVSAANIASLVIAGYFTGAVGLYFALSVMFFGVMMICATIRALHIFLSSCISIIIFVFISPIVIPTVLFKRTEGIFKGWLSELISFCFQPIILFAYIAIFVIVMDKSFIGSASFIGQAPTKTMVCNKICKNLDGTTAAYTGANLDIPPKCDQLGQKLIDPMNDSVACLINLNSFGKFPGLELFGISIPVLINVLESNAKEKILTLLKAALIMYLLLKFMDEIPNITKDLIGGTALPSSNPDPIKIFKKAMNLAREIQKRGMGAGKKASAMFNKKADRANAAIEKLGNKGKSTSEGSSGASSEGRPDGASKAGSGDSGSSGVGGGGDSGSSSAGSD